MAVETGTAQFRPLLTRRGHHVFHRHVGQGIRADRGTHSLNDVIWVKRVSHQFVGGGEVDPIKARPFHRRGRNADVDLGRSGVAKHLHQCALGVASHDGIVDNNEPLSADDFA